MNISKTTIAVIVAVVFLFILGFTGCSQYNGMVSQEENVDNAWAQVENQYQRRLDLIPNLVASVKGYAEHEQETFEAVTKARAGLSSAYEAAESTNKENAGAPADDAAVKKFQQTQQKLQSALGIYVNAVREAYPELKADKTFLDLMTQLEGTENRIATERNRYNDVVRDYNVRIRRFPASIFAGMFGFDKRATFAAEEGAQHAPKVEF